VKEAGGGSDVALLERCRSGDATAFDELVLRYKDRLYNMLYRFFGSEEDALEATQDVFIRAYRGLDGFRGESNVYTWLYRIATNLARNRLRDSKRKGRDKAVSLDAEAASCDARTPGQMAMSRELEEILQRCLDELPEIYRMTFVLRVFEEMSYEDIGHVMGCPRGTVKSRLNHARRLLRERLSELSVV